MSATPKLQLVCHHCGKTLLVKPEAAGKRITCPACSSVNHVPLASSAPRPTRAPAHTPRWLWAAGAGGAALLALVVGLLIGRSWERGTKERTNPAVSDAATAAADADAVRAELDALKIRHRRLLAESEALRQSAAKPKERGEDERAKDAKGPDDANPKGLVGQARNTEVAKNTEKPDATKPAPSEDSTKAGPAPDPKPKEAGPEPDDKTKPEPNELAFSRQALKLTAGDAWSYSVSSSNKSLDGRLLKITYRGPAEKKLAFAIQLGDEPPQVCTIPQEAGTFFSPKESAKGEFTVVGVGDEYPENVRKGTLWQKNNLFFTYDANNVRTTAGYRISGTGPHRVVTPAINCACAELEWMSAADNKLLSSRWFSPQLPLAVRSRERRPNSTAVALYELQSYRTATENKEASKLKIDRVQRQKAIGWIKAHNKFGEEAQIVDDFIFQLHAWAQASPSSSLRWAVGSGNTKGGKAYLLEWVPGRFSSRELTAAESEEVRPDRVVFTPAETAGSPPANRRPRAARTYPRSESSSSERMAMRGRRSKS